MYMYRRNRISCLPFLLYALAVLVPIESRATSTADTNNAYVEAEETTIASKALSHRFLYVFGHQPGYGTERRRARRTYQKKGPRQPAWDTAGFKFRQLEDVDNGDDDNDNDSSNVDLNNEKCSEFLVSFLEGTTDAHDTCEGISNAYKAAGKCLCLVP